MHPGMFAWWNARRRDACGPGVACGPYGGSGDWYGAPHGGHGGPGDEFGAGFGVRRPLRFLAHKLDLDDRQVAELAAVLAELKTERAQAAVDQRRATSSLADAIASDAFDEAKVKSVAGDRVKSDERVQDAVVRALGRIHTLLNPEQRAKFAYLLRTGALSI